MDVSYQCWVWWNQCQTLSWSQALQSRLESETLSLPSLRSLYSTETGGWHFPLRHGPKDIKEFKSFSVLVLFFSWWAIFQPGSPGWAQLVSPSVWFCIWPPLPSSVGCGFAVCWWDDASLCWWDLRKTSKQSESRKKETNKWRTSCFKI